jgi:hypothetical protein
MDTDKDKKTRFFKNSSGEIIPVFSCSNCVWGVVSPDDIEKWYCSLYDNFTTVLNAERGFPDFCELPTEDNLILTKETSKETSTEPSKNFVLSQVCNLLNEALKIDPLAVDNIITNSVICNKAMADHPTIQVSKTFGERYTVSVLGILNGLSDGSQYLIAYYDDNSGSLTGFAVVDSNVIDTTVIDTQKSVCKIEEKMDS